MLQMNFLWKVKGKKLFIMFFFVWAFLSFLIISSFLWFEKFNWNCYFTFTISFFISRWLPKATTAMRPVGPADSSSSSYSDCILVVGVSRPKLAALFFSVMLISLFLTFHILYDSAVYSIQVSFSLPSSCSSI